MKKFKHLVVRGTALLLLTAGITLASAPRAFDRALSVSGPAVLDISTGPGGIKITKGDEDRVRIRGVIRPLYGRVDLGLAEESIRSLQNNPPIEQTGNHIRIGYTQVEQLRAVSMTIEIQAPRASVVHAATTSGGIDIQGQFSNVTTTTVSGHTGINGVTGRVAATSHSGGVTIRATGAGVSVRTESGGVEVASVRGELVIESRSGRIEASEVGADVSATTRTGGISLDNVKGSINARNSSGSIDAFQLEGAVHAETTSGAIRIGQIRPAPIRAIANSGAIKVDLASGGAYTIDAQSRSGRVSSSISGNSGTRSDAHHLQQLLAGGGSLVDLDTRSSRIDID